MVASTGPEDAPRSFRRAVYLLLIVTSLGGMVGRIFAVKADHRQTPFLSANDRSRWCTIRALVDYGTYAIDDVVIDPRTGTFDRRWQTIDMVRHKGRDGREHYYSSKPTLLPTLLAGEYWVIKHLFGAGLARQPFYVGRFMLVATNVVPMALYFVLLTQLVERYGQTSWGRLFVMACAAWGTFLTTFSVTLNNHLPAAISVLVASYAALAIWYDGERRLAYFVIAGLLGAFAAANELPAVSLLVMLGAALLYKSPRRTLIAFVPAAAVVLAGFFSTNLLAHDSWRPPYAHRRDGRLLAELPYRLREQLHPGVISEALRSRLNRRGAAQGGDISPAAELAEASIIEPQCNGRPVRRRWTLWDPDGQDRLAIWLVQSEPPTLQVRAWDNWYEYQGSYWLAGRRKGIDRGEPSRLVYAFHMLIGHHGIFSLTPIWLMTVVGVAVLLVGPEQPGTCAERLWAWLAALGIPRAAGKRDYRLRALAVMVLVLSVVCFLFYVARPMADRNYGGVTCGLRWLFWFTPLWLLCALPAADALGSTRLGRAAAYGLLAVSALSAAYGALNPWVHPWIYAYWQYLGI